MIFVIEFEMELLLMVTTYIVVLFRIFLPIEYIIFNLFIVLQRLFLEARVLGLGPRFMSIYIHKLAVSWLCVTYFHAVFLNWWISQASIAS